MSVFRVPAHIRGAPCPPKTPTPISGVRERGSAWGAQGWEEGGGRVRVPGVSVCTGFGKRSLRLHDAAFVLVVMRVLKSESLLWSVFFQVRQLLAVDGSSALPAGNEKRGRLVRGETLPNPPVVGPKSPVRSHNLGFWRLKLRASCGDSDGDKPQQWHRVPSVQAPCKCPGKGHGGGFVWSHPKILRCRMTRRHSLLQQEPPKS